jgi:signal transduction histidine kinase
LRISAGFTGGDHHALDVMHDEGKLTIEAEAGDRGAVIRLGDTGEGISPEIIDRIFDPFFTTKSDRGGAGLGLSSTALLNH